ncbi:carbohydrate kinase family protein [Candidatus Woesebacteria bacterium]|nr:carbohydrate kinase family protein [Candidatus Woesebacteria bacterium]
MNNLQLLSIGDATLDVFLEPTEHEQFCEVQSKESFICFTYGDKIPVKHLDFSVGGNAANNAVGTKRLGVNSALVSTLGDDIVGKMIVEKLHKEEVDLNYVIMQAHANTNFSNVINYGGERTIFSYHAPRSYEFPVNLPETDWVYLTSMGETFQPFYDHFVDWKRQHPNVKLAFNPGSRQLRAGLSTIQPVMELTQIIYVNKSEAETLTATEGKDNDMKELLKALSDLGPKQCIITDGAEGSYVYDGQKFIHAGILPVDAYERTGAGDSFGSGCISALIKGKSFEEALLWGTINSASVIGYVGGQRGLLAESDMPEWLEKARSSGVVVEEF